MSRRISRRVFVHRIGFVGGGVVLVGSACTDKAKPKADEPKKPTAEKPKDALTTSHRTFTNADFAVVSAACERVIPKDDDPGALDANVPEYIDRILQTSQLEKMKQDFVPGVAALDRRARRMFQVGFAEATPQQQDEAISVFKDSPPNSGEARWYELLVVLTMEGFLGDPSYGGNKDKVGWKLVGFDLVGGAASEPQPGYNGEKHLDHLRCGGGKGC